MIQNITAGLADSKKANQQYETRVRFSLAHELGHFLIPEHQGLRYLCTIYDLNDYREKSAEIEENQFTAELLIPSHWLTQEIRRHGVTLSMLKILAGECEASLDTEDAGLVPLQAWTYDDRLYKELYEESLYMLYLNTTLTVFRIPCDEFEEEVDG